MKAGKIEIRGDRKFSNGNFARFPILHRFENGEKWKDAKNAIERIETSRMRSWEGCGFEIWKLVLDVLDKIFFFGWPLVYMQYMHYIMYYIYVPKKCLTLGLCLEYETFIRGVFCPNLFVCVCVCVYVRFFWKK